MTTEALKAALAGLLADYPEKAHLAKLLPQGSAERAGEPTRRR